MSTSTTDTQGRSALREKLARMRDYINQRAKHRHDSSQGDLALSLSQPILSRVRIPLRPIVSRSLQKVRINSEMWGGFRVGEPLPLRLQIFPTTAERPAFGTTGRLVYIEDLDVIYVDVGTAWVAIAEEGAIDWANILNKPSTFPPSGHHTSHEHSGSDAVSITYSDLLSIPSTFTPGSHGASAHSGDVIPDANQDFNYYQAIKFVVENLASLGAAGHAGRLAFNIGDSKVYYDDGSNWVAW